MKIYTAGENNISVNALEYLVNESGVKIISLEEAYNVEDKIE